MIDSDGRPIKNTRSSFYHHLCRLEWVPAYRPLEGQQPQRKYLCPNSVYLNSPEVFSLLGTHVDYVDIDPSDFSRALGKNMLYLNEYPCRPQPLIKCHCLLSGMMQTISVDVLIKYLKEWCVNAEDNQQPADESEGASFTSTVQHIHNIYNYLHTNCPQSSLKELFQHTPAVFIEYNRCACGSILSQVMSKFKCLRPRVKRLFHRRNDWCSGRFYHLKEVCWSDPTTMFMRYKKLTHAPDSPVQEPKVLAPFYTPLDGMRDFFTRVSIKPNICYC